MNREREERGRIERVNLNGRQSLKLTMVVKVCLR